MKKTVYLPPRIEMVTIANVHLLTGSEKVRSLHSDDGFSMTDGGTFDEDDR